MRKTVLFLFLLLVLLVSCTTFGAIEKKSNLAKIGKEGDLIITGKGAFFSSEYSDKLDRICVAYSKDGINGCAEGNFNKITGYFASKYLDINDYGLDHYQPERGLFVFSSGNAKEFSSELKNRSDYIDDFYLDRMLDADFAVYSDKLVSKYENLEQILILIKNGLCNAEFKASDESKANGLFIAIKSSYVSFMTKGRMVIDYQEVNKLFTKQNDTVYINNLPYGDFVEYFVGDILNYGR